jgi:hypothetical protein
VTLALGATAPLVKDGMRVYKFIYDFIPVRENADNFPVTPKITVQVLKSQFSIGFSKGTPSFDKFFMAATHYNLQLSKDH